jgi:hypothetical protein
MIMLRMFWVAVVLSRRGQDRPAEWGFIKPPEDFSSTAAATRASFRR